MKTVSCMEFKSFFLKTKLRYQKFGNYLIQAYLMNRYRKQIYKNKNKSTTTTKSFWNCNGFLYCPRLIYIKTKIKINLHFKLFAGFLFWKKKMLQYYDLMIVTWKKPEYYKRHSNDKVVCKLKFGWNIHLEDKKSQDMKPRIYMIHPIGHTLNECSLNYTFCKVYRRIPMDNLEIKDLGIL